MIKGLPRVVVTGLGALTPLGNSVDEFWNSMMAGKSGAAPITHFDASDYDTRFACEIKDLDPSEFLDRKTVRRMDPFTQYGLIAAQAAIEDAGIGDMSQAEKDLFGITMGSGIGGLQNFTEQTTIYVNEGHRRLSPFFIPMIIADIASGIIAINNGFRGPNYCTVSACATGNNSIGDAFMLIRQGYAKGMLCGGTEASVCELGIGGFNAMKALSTRNDDPEKASRPFDKNRDGFVLGEGAGALIVEELEHAKERGAKIYCEILGLGMSADAHHITAPHPEGEGAKLAMRMMLRDAGIEPEDVDYLNMHGTSTPLGDIAETNAIKQVFGDHAYKLSLSSTKSMMGHLLGAAGAVEAIATVLAVVNDKIPPTINFDTPDEQCDLDYTFNEAKERTVNIAASNAFGFGGHNTSIVVGKYTD